MTEYYNLKFKLSDFQLGKLTSATKNATGVTLILSSDIIGTDKNNFLHNLLLNNRY